MSGSVLDTPTTFFCGSNAALLALLRRSQGYNDYGQVGDGTTTQRSTARKVQGLPANTTVADVKCGAQHCCALTVTKRLFCWGYNAHGQLGDYSTTDRSTAVEVLTDIDSCGVGLYDTCALVVNGSVYCWVRRRRRLSEFTRD